MEVSMVIIAATDILVPWYIHEIQPWIEDKEPVDLTRFSEKMQIALSYIAIRIWSSI